MPLLDACEEADQWYADSHPNADREREVKEQRPNVLIFSTWENRFLTLAWDPVFIRVVGYVVEYQVK